MRGGPSATSIDSTASPKRNVTLRVAHLVEELVDDLAVEELERPLAPLDQRHRTPRAAKIEVYSMPMTPAPTTASVRGSCFSLTMSSVFRMTSPSARIPGGWRRMGADRDQDVLGGDLPPAAAPSGSSACGGR